MRCAGRKERDVKRNDLTVRWKIAVKRFRETGENQNEVTKLGGERM